jgi:hypothetical protein
VTAMRTQRLPEDEDRFPGNLRRGKTWVIPALMKTAVSLPDPLFAAAEAAAKRLRISRSKLYATAIARFLEEQRSSGVTERLNEVYATQESTLDPILHELQLRSLPREAW